MTSAKGWMRLRELTLNDLKESNIWLYEERPLRKDIEGEYDLIIRGQRFQEWIKPDNNVRSLSESDENTFLVLTKFTLNDDSILYGYCYPQETSGIDYTQPVIITSKGHVPLYYPESPEWKEPMQTCRKLGKAFEDVFPMKCQALVECDGEFYEVTIADVALPPNT